MSNLPALPLGAWSATYETLHRWIQIVGKTRLAYAPMQNHWWQAALYLTPRGLGTSSIPYGDRTFDVELDFIDHRLHLRTSDGSTRAMNLVPQSVARFYSAYLRMLGEAGIDLEIWPAPCELSDTLPFAEDELHAAYDSAAANRCWRVLGFADSVFKEFRTGFLGKCSPVHFWWGSFDLAHTRFSGRRAPLHPGGIPNLPDSVTREAYSHECYSAGWWPGSVGGPLTEPAFYAYAYPEPEGFSNANVKPSPAYYHPDMHEWFLPYEKVRASGDPAGMILEFLDSTYAAAADLGRWDRSELERLRA